MAATKKKVVNVDTEAAKDAARRVGKRTRKAVASKVAGTRQRAKQKGLSTVAKLTDRAADARRSIEKQIGRRREGAIQVALSTCVELSRKQLAALQKLESHFRS